jgi:hypothetical protein
MFGIGENFEKPGDKNEIKKPGFSNALKGLIFTTFMIVAPLSDVDSQSLASITLKNLQASGVVDSNVGVEDLLTMPEEDLHALIDLHNEKKGLSESTENKEVGDGGETGGQETDPEPPMSEEKFNEWVDSNKKLIRTGEMAPGTFAQAPNGLFYSIESHDPHSPKISMEDGVTEEQVDEIIGGAR